MLELSVCIGSSCHMRGAYNVIQTFQQMIEDKKLHDKVSFKASFCMKECNCSTVSVRLNEKKYRVDAEKATEFFGSVVEPLLYL